MKSLFKRVLESATLVRVAPFALFVVITAGQGMFGESSKFWLYLVKTLLGAWFVVLMWPRVREMRLTLSWEAVVVGVGVFVVWVGLEGHYPSLGALFGGGGEAAAKWWNPHAQFGEGSALAWLFIATRFAGSVLVVPFLEEVFYRSFVYRYVTRPDFLAVPLNHFAWGSLLITAGVFGLAHFEWLPGILCGLAYQALVLRRNRLGDAIVAHAITNLLLGAWVVWKGAWQFW